MATPFSRFRPVPGLTAPPAPTEATAEAPRVPVPLHNQREAEIGAESHAVEFDTTISAHARIVLPGNNQMKFAMAFAGHTVTVWADLNSIHVTHAGEVIRTRQSRLTLEDLALLRLRGRPAGPEPSQSAAPKGPLPLSTAIEIDRTVSRDGDVGIAGQKFAVGVELSGQRVVIRLDRHLAHVIADGYLVKTIAVPSGGAEQAGRLAGAREAAGPLPPARQGSVKVIRTIPADGITMVGGQRLRVGRAHAGKTVTIHAEDTIFRVLYEGVEIKTHVRKNNNPITHLRTGRHRPKSANS